MAIQKVFTLVNPQNGNLAFKIFSFEDNSSFEHLQSLNSYMIIIVADGQAKIKTDFAEYFLHLTQYFVLLRISHSCLK